MIQKTDDEYILFTDQNYEILWKYYKISSDKLALGTCKYPTISSKCDVGNIIWNIEFTGSWTGFCGGDITNLVVPTKNNTKATTKRTIIQTSTVKLIG